MTEARRQDSRRTGASPKGSSRQPPIDDVHWSDLAKGDRIHHFDYGDGTVQAAGPLWLLITWDNPDEHLNHHSPLMARYLTRLLNK